MEEVNSNSILYYCSVCDCIMSFQISNIDKKYIQSIKEHLVNNSFINSTYILESDIERINNLISKTLKKDLIYLLDELKSFLENYKIFTFFS